LLYTGSRNGCVGGVEARHQGTRPRSGTARLLSDQGRLPAHLLQRADDGGVPGRNVVSGHDGGAHSAVRAPASRGRTTDPGMDLRGQPAGTLPTGFRVLNVMWKPNEYSLDLPAKPKPVVAEQVFDLLWRFDFTRPGFCLLDVGPAMDSHTLR